MRKLIMTLPLLAVLLAADIAAAQQYPRADLLIEPAELMTAAGPKKYLILDARSQQKYLAGHLPGAARVDLTEWAKVFAKSQEPREWETRLAQAGVLPNSSVVVYSDDLRESARLWWILRYWGVKDVRLLNGGWTGWLEAKGAISKEDAGTLAVENKFTPESARLATKQHVLDQLKNKKPQIIDTRTKAEHCGDVSQAKRGGAIPGAVHLEWVTVVDEKSQRFKGPTELQKLFRDAGIQLDQPTITYCQSGGRSSVTAFALELMGGKEVRNYYRSWAEWGNDPETPIVKPEK